MRYITSKYILILHEEESLFNQHNKSFHERVFIKDECSDRSFLINSTIEIFIKKFAVAKTLAEVTAEIATEVNASINEIKKLVSAFFKYCRYRKFIVPENYTEAKAQEHSLFNNSDVIDEYEIVKLIDKNENAEVYQGIDLKLNAPVIIKLKKITNRSGAEEIKKEYECLERLSQTGVVPQAHAFIEKESYTYFAQEFIEGLSLPQFIRRKKNSTRKYVSGIIEEILKAFKKIHTENIVHGDIHPSNIIITEQAKIKVLDFGLAINHSLEKTEIVNFGGAYFFMPPERIKKTTHKKFSSGPDFYSDVFQLGVVLYVLLYNEYPFNGLTWEELAKEIKEKQIEFPLKPQYNFLVPGWLKNIISICVAKKPSGRFSNAAELYNAFLKNRSNDASKIGSAVKV